MTNPHPLDAYRFPRAPSQPPYWLREPSPSELARWFEPKVPVQEERT